MLYKVPIPLILIFTFLSLSLCAQKNFWDDLSDVSFKNKKDQASGFEITYPVFGEKVTQLKGKEIILKGFMVPLDQYTSEKKFVLSSLPYNICFFCGGAGPETVIEVFCKEQVDFTDDPIFVKGIFEPNSDNIEQLMYILKDATLVD
ncbi:hypothetical protein [Chondrinema litorale]|uniref:hypothetical protein n=1 Tax=Chondrinema litorale TaxID=2994555 RepID=UPI002542BFB7|nr:hypothetical protein [Chondrinema litorale]UZR95828.1 hypothetical protein OQ292_08380 [Chondrinema litorale]